MSTGWTPWYYALGGNVYYVSMLMLISFDTLELVAAENKYRGFYWAFNFYLAQLRMQIEMVFRLLTTKSVIFSRRLAYKDKKNAKIIRVATKLHNFRICMKPKEGGGGLELSPTLRAIRRLVNLQPCLGRSPPRQHGRRSSYFQNIRIRRSKK